MDMVKVRVASSLVLNIELELSIDELVDIALVSNHAQDFDLNVDLDSVYVDDVAPLIIKLCDAKRRASLLSSVILENTLYLVLVRLLVFKN